MALALASIAKSFVTTDFFEKVVRLWDTETGQAIGPSIRLAYPVDGIVFHPDNKRLLTVDYAATRIWHISEDERLLEDLGFLYRLLSAHQIDKAGNIVPLDAEELSSIWNGLRSKYPTEFSAAATA